MQKLLDNEKYFFKAQLHCHSTYSDGTVTVEEQKKLFKENGYSVVAFTDHEHLIDNSRLDDEGFLTITSCELAIKEFATLSTLKKLDMRVAHLNLYARDQHNTVTPCYSSVYDHYINDEIKDRINFEGEYQMEYSPECINRIIKTAKEKGFLVSYNHPEWSLENATDYLQYEGLDFVEVYNHTCAYDGGESYSINVLDDMLRSGKKVYATMCDDSHKRETMFGGWVMINADRLEYGTIITALENGSFYCTQGPEIYSLIREGDTVKINTSCAKQIAISTRGRRTEAVNGKDITQGEFSLRNDDGYFRITVIDKYGNHAHTQAYKI
ncbi:MAG: PHP domain-containing protein [Clostridia bacterium]|nr:PHP domain-containing protein [Clostridia bacterium]